jgi:hypothetical protein
MTYLGFEPGTFGYQVGNATNWTIEVVIYEESILSMQDIKLGQKDTGSKYSSFLARKF